jgi:hypothetical protein
LVFAQALGVMEEKVCDLSQGANTLRRRTASDGFFEFFDVMTLKLSGVVAAAYASKRMALRTLPPMPQHEPDSASNSANQASERQKSHVSRVMSKCAAPGWDWPLIQVNHWEAAPAETASIYGPY